MTNVCIEYWFKLYHIFGHNRLSTLNGASEQHTYIVKVRKGVLREIEHKENYISHRARHSCAVANLFGWWCNHRYRFKTSRYTLIVLFCPRCEYTQCPVRARLGINWNDSIGGRSAKSVHCFKRFFKERLLLGERTDACLYWLQHCSVWLVNRSLNPLAFSQVCSLLMASILLYETNYPVKISYFI
jgi:hypothetical protein